VLADEKLTGQDSLIFNQVIDSLKNYYPNSDDSLSVFTNYILDQFPSHHSEVYGTLAMVHYSKSNFTYTEYCFAKNADLLLADSLMVKYAENLANIGVVKEVSGDYIAAIEFYLKALDVFKKQGLEEKASVVYNNIGIVYQQLNEPDKALEFYHLALSITERLKNEDLSAKRYNNIASIYEEYTDKQDSALYYYYKAHKYYALVNSKYLPVVENNIAYLHIVSGNYNKADSLLNKTLKHYRDIDESTKIAPVLRNFGQLCIKTARYKQAEQYLTEALGLSQEIKNKELEIEVLIVFINLYEQINEYKKANVLLKQLSGIEKDVKGKEHKDFVERLQVQFSVKEKNQTIEILELKNKVQTKKMIRLWVFVSFLIIALIVWYYIYRLQKKNSKLQLLQMQRDIADYVSQIEEIKEQSLKQEQESKDKILEKLKSFGLTEREEEVLILISQGYKNAEIAEKMFVSLNTIKTHTKNIFIKLDVKNRTQAAKKVQFSS
jgi:ATP/maltotriose-dependent transcriptional regulator MalT